MGKKKDVYVISGTQEIKAPLVCSIRLLLACLAFLGFFLCYAQRNGLSVSIVCMVDPDADNVTLSNDINSVAVSRNIPASCHKHTVEKSRSASQVLLWPKQTRGVILGSFYWGYALTQVASSVAVNLLGPKRFLAILIFISSAATMLLPIFAKFHPSFVILIRVVAGAAQGGLWPTIFRFWATWAPAAELTTLLSFQSSGPSMGTIVSLIIGGLFCTFSLNDAVPYLFRYGWEYFFYLLGGLGILWSVVWLIFASDTPATNTHISENEKEYIRSCKAAEKIQDTRTKVPWGPMLKSQGFWCILISMFFCDFGLYAIWAVVPEYMNEVLLFSIEENGFLSALPHMASFVVVLSTGGLADFIIRRKFLSRVNTRKLFHGIGTLSPAICLLIISFLDCERRYSAVLLLVIGIALNGFMMSGGYVVNVGDFSGVHSGVVFGICNTISCIGGFCAPYITSIITKHKTPAEWKIAFTLYAGSFLISAIAFAILARGETEPWARDDVHDEKINYDVDAKKELMEMSPVGIVPDNPVV
ncbi:unnamed protein product [Adineta steineri]|uniref:Major facilitator superfamily (MFS) profile domain-containing protein n=1 Tax=Adineta steineri TaxID=433720 RepID=A0A814HLL2_9BILA|nr:unnamed protein product [Adineta steineri]CAF3507223.1 unnamed protein product [Adineta steineri]